MLLVVLGALCGMSRGAEEPEAVTAATPERSMEEQIKNPVDWLTWGADLRVREEYLKNNLDLMNEFDDNRNVICVRGRIWTEFGPFLKSDELGGGLTFVARLTAEPRYYIQRSGFAPFAVNAQEWDEVAWDNLYVRWDHVAALPVSISVGRQDLVKGRGWVILDGTPLDGSRTIYSDAAVATLQLDEIKTTLDLILLDNKAHSSRIEPFNEADQLVHEYDLRLFSAYLTSAILDPMQLHTYYIYADEDLVAVSGTLPPHRTIHMVGALAQGKANENVDYYIEGGYQWGHQGSSDHSAWGVNSDIGYTFSDVPCKPRIHAGYEYLTGDDPNTKQIEGWDSLMGRWPQWSELFASRYALEGGLPGSYANLHRAVFGVSAQPIPKMTALIDYSPLWADQHSFGTSYIAPGAPPAPPVPMPFGNGYFRGHFVKAVTTYRFNKYVDGELWFEYFKPGSFYDRITDDALYFRWQLNFTF
jgi:hypothetical protein